MWTLKGLTAMSRRSSALWMVEPGGMLSRWKRRKACRSGPRVPQTLTLPFPPKLSKGRALSTKLSAPAKKQRPVSWTR
jgi:hypothetical protein